MNTTTASNKALIQHIHAQLDQGNSRPFLEGFADDATWKLEGSTAWSRTYRGRKAIREELLNPLFAQFATPTPAAPSTSWPTRTGWWCNSAAMC